MNPRPLISALVFGLLLAALNPTFATHHSIANLPKALPPADYAVSDTTQKLSDDGLQVTYEFNRSVAALGRSQLSYRKIATTGTTEGQVPFETPAPNDTTFIFKIPRSAFEGTERLEFQVKLVNTAGLTVFASRSSSVDLRYYNSITEQLKRANERAAELGTQVTGLDTKLNAANTKYEAAQKSLNTITGGLEPQRVNFVQYNLITDGRIVLTLNTGNIPGRIRATLDGPSGFTKSVDSENLSTQHIITFDGLMPSTQYRIKAVALTLEDRAEIASSIVDMARDVRLTTQTKAAISPPVASFEVTPFPDRLKVGVRSNQDVFAEITYLPLDSGGGPINTEVKRVGSIRPDDFGSYTGDQVVSANKLQEFTLPDLKENTQYKVVVKLVNQIGKTPGDLLEKNPRTGVKPTPFDFTKVINVQLSPVGVKVVWNSTTKATTAKLQVVYEGETTVTIDKPAAINGNEITANIDVAEVVQMISKSKVPILRLSMTEGNNPALQRDVQVSFVMPTNAAVKSNPNITGTVRSSLLEVTNKIEKGEGINWKKILGAGLSLVVKTFLPI